MAQTKVKSGLLNFPDQTDFVKLPSGTTAQRPVSPEKGYSRYNTTDNKLEFWDGTEWQQLPGLTPPIITSLSYPGDDLAADPVGGQTITINGGDFKAGATVTVGGTTPSVITFVSATEITFEAPAKAAGDYDIVVTNVDGGNATSVNGMSYNGVPSWTTPAGNLGTFPAGSTIPTITLVATEPDSGVISYSVTTGALPTGLTLTGADIDGNVPTPAGETTYNFSVTASDDENQESTERAFNIIVYLQVTNTVSAVDPFGDSSGIALYKLDGDATDESGNYNGTASNITWGGAGVFVTSASFNGSNSNILLPVSTYLQSTGNKSYSVWFKTSVTSGNHSLFDDYTTGSGGINHHHYIRGDSGQLQFVTYRPSPTSFVGETSGLSLNDGNWHHLVVVSDNSNSRVLVYVDNNLEITLTGLPAFTQGKTAGYLGSYNSAGTGYSWDGEMDQLRIFNRSLLPLEIESLYEERTVICGGQAETVDILGDNSCIALYPLDGNANDLSGNYSGTPTDVSYGVGEFDSAGVFNGSSSRIALPQNSLNSFTEYSISTWINTSSSADQTIINNWGYQNTQAEQGWLIQKKTDNKIRVLNYNGGPTQIYDSTGVISLSTWVNVIVTNTQSQIKIYFNGVLDSTHSSSGFTFNASYPMRPHIGAYQYSAGTYGFFNGSIDQVRIFNKALSAGEVTTLYNETACDVLACSGTTNTLDILGDGSCVAAYPLDGSPLDLSGNYNGVQTDVTYPQGYFDLAGSFNGSSSLITIPSSINTSYINPSGQFSVSLWVKLNEVGTNQYRIIDFDTANNIELTLNGNGLYPGKIMWIIYNTSYELLVSSTTVVANTWYHISVTYNNGFSELFINGSSEGTMSKTLVQSSQTIGLGARANNTVNTNGSIDQVRIFNKALSAGEVTTLYNETACN